MSDFQLALIGVGLIAVLGVWAYNLWQERGLRRSLGDLAPPLPAAARQEPAEVAPESLQAEPAADMPEIIADMAADAEQRATPAVQALPDDMAPVDADIDCVVRFDTAQPLSPAALWAAQAGWAGDIARPMRWLATQPGASAWVVVDPASSERFVHWMAALQLVDRRGPVSDADVGRFFDGLKQLGKSFGFAPELPSRAETLLRASDLDARCAAVDVQFALNVIHAQGGAFPGMRLRTVCEASGLELDGNGHFVSRDASGRVEFSLSNLGSEGFDAAGLGSLATHGVILAIDVPLVADGLGAFDRMVLAAKQLAINLGGVLADTQRAPLSDGMIDMIRAKIVELQTTMQASGIAPGSARAERLFA